MHILCHPITAHVTIIILKTDKQIILKAINLDIDAMPTTAGSELILSCIDFTVPERFNSISHTIRLAESGVRTICSILCCESGEFKSGEPGEPTVSGAVGSAPPTSTLLGETYEPNS